MGRKKGSYKAPQSTRYPNGHPFSTKLLIAVLVVLAIAVWLGCKGSR